jgi:ABC-2 type transport system ATP-binding protein
MENVTPLAIECRGLTRHYEDVRAVDGLDLAVRPGECFGLLGPNGAGKTTTIEILEGLNRPDSGEVTVLGRRWGTDARELRERLGISLQESRFSDKLTVFETLRLFRSFYRDGRDPEETMRDCRSRKKGTRGSESSPAASGRDSPSPAPDGAARDPVSGRADDGLDPQSRRQLWDHIQAFRARGGTVLLTTHYMEEAERLCDRVAIMDHGRIIAQGTPTELIGRLRAPHILEFSSIPRRPPRSSRRSRAPTTRGRAGITGPSPWHRWSRRSRRFSSPWNSPARRSRSFPRAARCWKTSSSR